MRAAAHRFMQGNMKDPAFAKALRSARKSHPNNRAMVANLGLSESAYAEMEQKVEQMMSEGALDDLLHPKAADASALVWGQRVVTVGLSSDWLNGATCSVTKTLDSSSGRYLVRVHAPPEAVRKCGGSALLKRENLECQALSKPRVDPASQWLDEFGWVCSKSINYGQQCPKSHDVVCKDASRSDGCVCSVCDESEAPDVWSCCGGCSYSVCIGCRNVLLQQDAGRAIPPSLSCSTNSHEFPVLVSCLQLIHPPAALLCFKLHNNQNCMKSIFSLQY